jgi:hypothetical protein
MERMRYLIAAMLIVVSIIHWLPLVGVFGGGRLAALYGVSIADPTVHMLMRHRAVLFGIVGGLLLLAAFRSHLQPTAFAVGFVSVISFLWLSRDRAHYTAQIERVFRADIVALVALLVGLGAYVYLTMRRLDS